MSESPDYGESPSSGSSYEKYNYNKKPAPSSQGESPSDEGESPSSNNSSRRKYR